MGYEPLACFVNFIWLCAWVKPQRYLTHEFGLSYMYVFYAASISRRYFSGSEIEHPILPSTSCLCQLQRQYWKKN